MIVSDATEKRADERPQCACNPAVGLKLSFGVFFLDVLHGDAVRAHVREADAGRYEDERSGEQLLGPHEMFNVDVNKRGNQSGERNVRSSSSPIENFKFVANEAKEWFDCPRGRNDAHGHGHFHGSEVQPVDHGELRRHAGK